MIGLDGLKYVLSYYGFDILALNGLYKKKIITSVGDQVGYGKESDVYEVLDVIDRPYVLKIHREGISFKNVLNNRPNMYKRNWFNIATKSALREKAALNHLYPYVSVPKPIATDRHFIVLEKVGGRILKDTYLEDPEEFFSKIINEIKKSYHRGIIHGDLSEYNILIDEDKAIIIDWPQFIYSKIDGSDKILIKDVKNIIYYFSHTYSLNKDINDVLKEIKS